MLEAKRKELTRLNNAYKNTLGNAKVGEAVDNRACVKVFAVNVRKELTQLNNAYRV